MILDSKYSVKKVAQAAPGELIVFELRSFRALGLVLSVNDNHSLIGLLQTSETQMQPTPPFAFNLDRRHNSSKQCLSYGLDWVLELPPNLDSVPGDRSSFTSPAAITLDEGLTSIFFPSMEQTTFSPGYTFDFATSSLVDMTERGVAHRTWRIWASQADRDHARGHPIFEHLPA